MESVGSEVNLFEPVMNQTAMIGEMVQELTPLQTLRKGPPIEFQIKGSGKNYSDLNNSKLEMKVKLKTPMGGDNTDNENLSPLKLSVHSLLQSVSMRFADKLMNQSNNLYLYRALVERLLI